MLTRAEEAIAILEIVSAAANEQLAAMKFLSEAGKQSKVVKNHIRYGRVKIQTSLVTGGYKRSFAKQLAVRFETPDACTCNPAEIKPGETCVWTSADDSNQELPGQFRADRHREEKHVGWQS